MKSETRKIIQAIINELPYSMRVKAEKQIQGFTRSHREPLTPALVEKLYRQVLAEQKESKKQRTV